MHFEQAEHTLETIRTLMERSQRYQHISGYSGLLAGATALAGCGVLRAEWLPWAPAMSFGIVWTGVFLVALVGHSLLTFARARQRGEPVWSRQAQTVGLAVLPGLIAGLTLTGLLWQLGRYDLLPAVWLLLYGCGTLATSFFAPPSIRYLGMTCLACGIVAIIVTGFPLLTMAVGFGLTHLAFGGTVVISEWKEARETALLMSWQQ